MRSSDRSSARAPRPAGCARYFSHKHSAPQHLMRRRRFSQQCSFLLWDGLPAVIQRAGEINLETQKLRPILSRPGGLQTKSGSPSCFHWVAALLLPLRIHIELRCRAPAHMEPSMNLMLVEGQGGGDPCWCLRQCGIRIDCGTDWHSDDSPLPSLLSELRTPGLRLYSSKAQHLSGQMK